MAEDAAWHHRSTAQPEKKTKRKRTKQKRYAMWAMWVMCAMSMRCPKGQSSASRQSRQFRVVDSSVDLLPTATGTAFTAAHPAQVAAKAVTLTLIFLRRCFKVKLC
jgi:hypothetical protein